MATPEGKVKVRVRALLGSFDRLYYHMPVQNGMGSPSLDFIGCYFGHYFAVETKAPGEDLTPRQEITKSQIEEAGGKVFKIDGPVGYEELSQWLRVIEATEIRRE